MSEQFVAIGRGSLYPESRGKNMPESGAAHTGRGKESKTTPKTNGPTSPEATKGNGKTKAESRNQDKEQEKKREEAEKRLKEDLKKEKKEVEESSERTKRKARESVEAVSKPPTNESRRQKEQNPQVPSKENPVIVESYPHLENCKREQAVAFLRTQNVKFDLPKNWDRMTTLARKNWYEEKGIKSVLPSAEFMKSVYVDQDSDGRVSIVGHIEPAFLEPKNIQKLIDDAEVSLKLGFPEDFSDKDPDEKLKWYRENNVMIMQALGGGAMGQPLRWPDNANVDADTAYGRLSELRREQRIMGANFQDRGDRLQLYQRLQNPDLMLGRFKGIETLKDEQGNAILKDENEVLERLRSLKFLEGGLGAAAFAVNRFDDEREVLNDRLKLFLNRDGKIERVLQTLANFVAQGVVNEEQQVWQDYLDHVINFIQARVVDNREYRFVSNAVSTINGFEQRLTDLGQLNLLNQFLPSAIRQQLVAVHEAIDQHFRAVEQAHPGGELRLKETLYRAVDREATSFRESIKWGSGVRSVRDIEMALFDAADSIVREAAESESVNQTGLIEWHTMKLLEDMRRQQEGEQQLETPIRWQDSLRNAQNNLRFIEAVDFAPEDFSKVRERLVKISENLNQHINQMTGPDQIDDKREAEAMASEINDIKDAVLALYDLRNTMEGSDMNPEEVLRHFANNVWKDTTFRSWFRRLDKDHKNQYFTDNQGRFNIQDRGMNILDKRLRFERRVMDNVEELSLFDLTDKFNFNNPANDRKYAQIARFRDRALLPEEFERLENLRRDLLARVVKKLGFAPPNWDSLTPAQQDAIVAAKAKEINAHWRVSYNAKLIMHDWHSENMFVGVSGIYNNPDPNVDDPNNGRKRLDMRKDELIEGFKTDLIMRGVDQNLVTEYERIGLLRQVINNAYHLRWMWGGFSDCDGLRVFDRDHVWFRDSRRGAVQRVGAFAYSRSTNMFNGRYVDHYGEFLVDEVRGAANKGVNYVFQREMLGKRRSMMGHNRLSVKIINDNLRNAPQFADKLVIAGGPTYQALLGEGARITFQNLLEYKINHLENIHKLAIGSIRLKDGNFERDGDNGYDYGWARGAAIEELFDDGEISMENIEWSKVFEADNTNVSKFNMGDWWSDRAKTLKYYSAEMFQEFSMQPNAKKFFELNSNRAFYSTREIRIFPWMKLVIPAMIEIGKMWRKGWKLPYNMAHAEKEEIIDYAVETHRLDPAYHHEMKLEYLGWGPFGGGITIRTLRTWMEAAGVTSKETGKGVPLILLLFLWEFIKGAFGQSQAQLAGK